MPFKDNKKNYEDLENPKILNQFTSFMTLAPQKEQKNQKAPLPEGKGESHEENAMCCGGLIKLVAHAEGGCARHYKAPVG